jgi:hypothetical protein
MRTLKYPIHFEIEVQGVPLFSNFRKQAFTYSERNKASTTKSLKKAVRISQKIEGANVVAYWLEDKDCKSNLLTGKQSAYGKRCVYGDKKGIGANNGNADLESFLSY